MRKRSSCSSFALSVCCLTILLGLAFLLLTGCSRPYDGINDGLPAIPVYVPFLVTSVGPEPGIIRGIVSDGVGEEYGLSPNEEIAVFLNGSGEGTCISPKPGEAGYWFWTSAAAECIAGLSGEIILSWEYNSHFAHGYVDGLLFYYYALGLRSDEYLSLTGGEYWQSDEGGSAKLYSYYGQETEAECLNRLPYYLTWEDLWCAPVIEERETAVEVADAWGAAFSAAQTALPVENPYAPAEFRILEGTVEQVSDAGDTLAYCFTLAAKYREGTPRLWICGGGWMGEGEWDGWVLNRRWVILAKGEDGLWRAAEHSPCRLTLD